MSGKKVVAFCLLLAAAGAGIFFFLKWNNKPSDDPEELLPESNDTGKTSPTVSLENDTFKEMSAVIEADPIWQQKVFPGDFYEAVVADYANIQAGNPRTPDYNYGKPGAFMSVADAWKNAMGFSNETHSKLWTLYNKYKSDIAKEQIV